MTRSKYDLGPLVKLLGDFQAKDSEETSIETIVSNALGVVEDAEMASLTVRVKRNGFETIGSTHPLASVLDKSQYALGEGPCVDSAQGGGWLRSGDLASDARWPRWGQHAAEHGYHSLLSVQMDSAGEPIGALNLYSSAPGSFANRDEIEMAIVYGVHAAHALTSSRLVGGLRTAPDTRHEIGMAQGILMERYRLSVDQSFAVLRRLSQHLNRKLRDVASQVVLTGELPDLALHTPDDEPVA